MNPLNSRQLLVAGLGACTMLLSPCLATAQAFAKHTLTMVVPYTAGGPSDFVARKLQPDLSTHLGQVMIIENVAGAAGSLGLQKMLNAAADGHTMAVATPMEMIQAPLAMAAVKYKPEELRLAGVAVTTTMVLASRKDLPAASVDELVAAAQKAGAKELSYASLGTGTMYHLMAEKFMQQTKLKMLHVPYKGVADILRDLMGGTVDLAFLPLAGSIPAMIKDGKIKAYGISAKQVHPMFPTIPTLTSSKALEDFEFDIWAGIAVPKNTPDAVVEDINKALAKALANPETRKAYEATGNQVAKPMSVAELNRFYAGEISRYNAIAKSINLQQQ